MITSTIGSFQIFQEAYVMTKNGTGGPANSLLFYNLHMWNKAFVAFDMGYAMAMSMILFLIVLVLTFINLKLAPRWVHYTGGGSCGNDDKNTKQIKPTASQKNHQLCGDVDHRDRAADSVAVDGLYVIETDGGDRALPADLFPRRNQSWQRYLETINAFPFWQYAKIRYSLPS